MKHLPTELLPLIIKYVDKTDLYICTLVNKSFYTATIPFLWRCYSEDSSDPPSRLLDCLNGTPPHHPIAKYLRLLKLDSRWNNTNLPLLMPHLNLLEDLTIIYRTPTRNANIDHLAQRCPNLKALRLWNFDLTQQTMDALGRHCHQLEELDLSGYSDLSSTTTSLFAPFLQRHGCPLKKLMISHRGDSSPWNDNTMIHLTRLTHLTKLHCSNGSVHLLERLMPTSSTTTTTTTTTAAAPAIPIWPHLTDLSLHSLHTIGDSQLIPLIQSHPQLQSLSLQDSSSLTDVTLNAIATFLPALTHLNLDFNSCITAMGIRRLVERGCPHLMLVTFFTLFITTADFPEAGEDCFAFDNMMDISDGNDRMLIQLDQDALIKIRLGA